MTHGESNKQTDLNKLDNKNIKNTISSKTKRFKDLFTPPNKTKFLLIQYLKWRFFNRLNFDVTVSFYPPYLYIADAFKFSPY